MRIERDEIANDYFDEIIDDFASIKAPEVSFHLTFFLIFTGKGWIYLCFDRIVFFEHKRCMTCIK